MPDRRAPPTSPAGRPRTFREKYDELEARRAELCARLRALGRKAEEHSAYKSALKLLNQTYRKEKVARRLAVLQSAAWLIAILERLATTL